VLSSDLVFEPDLVQELDAAGPDLALTESGENRILSSVNCAVEGDCIREFYVGPLRTPADPRRSASSRFPTARFCISGNAIV